MNHIWGASCFDTMCQRAFTKFDDDNVYLGPVRKLGSKLRRRAPPLVRYKNCRLEKGFQLEISTDWK